jgi:hypothetical protein
MMPKIKFSYSKTSTGRKHFINEDDVRVVLSRIPAELWERLRAVHFNDRAFGRQTLGYVNMGFREIAMCALPERISLSGICARRPWRDGRSHSPNEFGAVRGRQWPVLAVRRCMLYEVFLHELGHLQIIEPNARGVKRRFASETKAEEFAVGWRRQLWAGRFNHPDPVHNPPSDEELEQLNRELLACVTSGRSNDGSSAN